MGTDQNPDLIESPTTRELGRPTSVTVTVVGGAVDVVAVPTTRTAALEVHEISGPPLTLSWSGNTLRLEQLRDGDGQVWGALRSLLGASGAPRSRVRLTLSIPDDTSVSIKTVGADVLVGGSHGTVSVYSVSGGITLDRTTGTVDATTVSGSVEAASPAGELKVKTVTGGITVQDAVLRTTRVNTVAGRTILDLRHGPTLVTANSVSGELSIRIPAGSGYDATTGSASGHVVVDGEPLVSEGKRGGHRHSGDRSVVVKARTVSGDLVLLRRESGPATDGPLIGDPGVPGDVQDQVRRGETRPGGADPQEGPGDGLR